MMIQLESAPLPRAEPQGSDQAGPGEKTMMLAKTAVMAPVPAQEPAEDEEAESGGDEQRVRVQPVPEPAACVVPPAEGISEERAWLKRSLAERYDDAEGFAARVTSESPGLRGPDKASAKDAVTDLAAVRLYLSEPGRQLGDAIRSGTVGPHVPVGRCAASGLRRLPSYRGVVMLRATMGDSADECYPENGVVTEWGFCAALTDVHSGLPGDTNVLIWAMTARRTALLETEVPDRVMFLPGTNFKVLKVHSGEPNVVMLRELANSEIGEDGQVEAGQVPLDQVALAGLERAQAVLEDAAMGEELPAEHAEGFGAPPGLIIAGQ